MNEFSFDYVTGKTLYATRFQLDGNVFVTDGSSDVTWTAADDYDVTMTEDGVGGHYVGSFDASGNITAGVYPATIYLRVGGTPANTDPKLGRGIMNWDGSAELNQFTLNTQIKDDVIGVDGDTLKSLSDEIAAISVVDLTAVNQSLEDIKGTGFVVDTDSLVDLAHTGDDDDTLESLSDQINTLQVSQNQTHNIFKENE